MPTEPKRIMGDEEKNPAAVSGELAEQEIELALCASCGQRPAVTGRRVCCQTEDCWLRSLMGSMSVLLWNSTMCDLALAQVQQSAANMEHGD